MGAAAWSVPFRALRMPCPCIRSRETVPNGPHPIIAVLLWYGRWVHPSQECFVACACPAGVVGGDADNNIVELAKVGEDSFQLNVKDTLSPFQVIGVALSSITAEK